MTPEEKDRIILEAAGKLDDEMTDEAKVLIYEPSEGHSPTTGFDLDSIFDELNENLFDGRVASCAMRWFAGRSWEPSIEWACCGDLCPQVAEHPRQLRCDAS